MIMFNTFDEHLFVCQSLLKERRCPPTGGLREALEELWGRGVSMPSSTIMGLQTTPGASEVWFSPAGGKRLVTVFGGVAPRDVSCRSLFSCGDHERAYSGRVGNPESLLRCLF